MSLHSISSMDVLFVTKLYCRPIHDMSLYARDANLFRHCTSVRGLHGCGCSLSACLPVCQLIRVWSGRRAPVIRHARLPYSSNCVIVFILRYTNVIAYSPETCTFVSVTHDTILLVLRSVSVQPRCKILFISHRRSTFAYSYWCIENVEKVTMQQQFLQFL